MTTVRQVKVEPGTTAGAAVITLSPEPAPPQLTPWQRFELLGPKPWPGPHTSRLDAPMRVFFDQWGRPLLTPVPGLKGDNLLLTGPTGAGKTGGLHVLMADLAFREDLAIVFLDPHQVEGELWEDRCSLVAKGKEACARTINRLPAFMEARARRMKGRSWNVRVDGPRVLIICDEYPSIPAKARANMGRVLAEGRKFGLGNVVVMQRAQHELIDMDQRDNCRTRIACGAESRQASAMTLGDAAPLATEIPASLRGAAIVRVDAQFRPARFYLLSPPGPLAPDVDPYEIAAPQIARATASLNVDLGLAA